MIEKVSNFILIVTFIILQTGSAKDMIPLTHHHEFAIYMTKALYASEVECNEEIHLDTEIEWFCADFTHGKKIFEDRWITYSGVRPSKFKLYPISSWGDVFVEGRFMGLYGKLYDVAGGRLVVGYSSNSEEKLYIGFERANVSSKLGIGEPVPNAHLRNTRRIAFIEDQPEAKFAQETLSVSLTQATNAFSARGLEIISTRTMNRQDYGLAPLVATEGILFDAPSLCQDCGGNIFNFDNLESLEAMRSYYASLSKEKAGYIFTYGNILLRLSSGIPAEVAHSYAQALQELF